MHTALFFIAATARQLTLIYSIWGKKMKAKIIATLGPATNNREQIENLARAGVNIFRLNISHGDASQFVDTIKNIREVESKLNTVLTIFQDLSGPKIRIGILESPITFAAGDRAFLGPEDDGELPHIPFTIAPVLEAISPGDVLVLADGTLQLLAIEKRGNGFVLEAKNSGLISSRKGLALPGKTVKVPALTEKDRRDLKDGLKLGVDAVALSFVQTPEDILEAKKIIAEHGKAIPVCAKLERRNAVEHLDAILDVADIIMVARGDLGVECPLEDLPGIQKKIIGGCNQRAKPVIVATQMLLSMVSAPSPTRAETTDVANAVLDGADCVMLSEETAIGAHPVETVEYMRRIASKAEDLLVQKNSGKGIIILDTLKPDQFLSQAAHLLADSLSVRAVLSHSISGASGRAIAAKRMGHDVYVLTPSVTTLRYLNFSWGVQPRLVGEQFSSHLERVENFIDANPDFNADDAFVITAGQGKKDTHLTGTNLVKVYVK